MSTAAASVSSTTPATPQWQADDSVQSCPLCESKFTWYYRKHHCRKCGRVICHDCCSNFYQISSSAVVRPPEPATPSFLATIPSLLESESVDGTEEVRTCDACFSRLEQDRCRRMLGLDISTLDPRVAAQIIRDSIITPALLVSPPPSYSRASNILVAPITSEATSSGGHRRDERHEASPVAGSHHSRPHRARRDTHDNRIASSSAPSSRAEAPRELPEHAVPLRYVAFEMNAQDKMLGEECPICFEEYESGQQVARLECWCLFHVPCIKAWKFQKAGSGGCPLHFHD